MYWKVELQRDVFQSPLTNGLLIDGQEFSQVEVEVWSREVIDTD